jgi:hypothetical protein
MRPRLTFANVMSVIAAFIALGGASYAAFKLPSNSVGTKQLKTNAVTTKTIKKNAVTTAKIKKNAVTGAKVKESTLGQVPLAADAGALGGLPANSYASSPMWALVDNSGSILRQSGGISINTVGIARYDIAFPKSLSGRAISTTRAILDSDPSNSVGVEAGVCGLELDCGEFEVPNDVSHAIVVTTALAGGIVINQNHAFWIVAH